MREIKFRVWDKKEHVLSPVSEINFWNFGHVYAVSEDRYHHRIAEFKNYDLMQYTGLKDQAGVEIYEGDVVKAIFESPYHIGGIDIVGKVGFIDRKLSFAIIDACMLCEAREIEVIGNVYENPKLMEG